MIVKKFENLAKSPGDHNYNPPIKEFIGAFNTNPHYLKLYHALNSAYTNYKVHYITSTACVHALIVCII